MKTPQKILQRAAEYQEAVKRTEAATERRKRLQNDLDAAVGAEEKLRAEEVDARARVVTAVLDGEPLRKGKG